MSTVGHSEKVSSLVKQVASLCEQADGNICTDEARRAALLQATKELVVVLEKPTDAVYQNAFLVFDLFPFSNCCWSLERILLTIRSLSARSNDVCQDRHRSWIV